MMDHRHVTLSQLLRRRVSKKQLEKYSENGMSDTAFIILVLIIAFGIVFGIAYLLSTRCFLRVSPETFLLINYHWYYLRNNKATGNINLNS